MVVTGLLAVVSHAGKALTAPLDYPCRPASPAGRETGKTNAAVQALVTSASRKLPLLRAVSDHLATVAPDATVVASDANPFCLAAYAWQPFVAFPRLDDVAPQTVIDAVTAVSPELLIPTRDADVLFFADHHAALAARGTWCLAGSEPAVARCLDKLAFAVALTDAGVPVIPTVLDPAAARSDRVVVKERHGAGSRGLGLDLAPGIAATMAEALAEPVFQPFVPGREVSIDAYRARDGRVLGVIVRSRDVVVGGESKVTTTVDPGPYAALTDAALTALELTGHAVLQAIDGADGPVLVECNPRLGGASTLSLAAGLSSVEWAWLEAHGRDPGELAFEPAPPGLRLVRTAHDTIGRVDP